MSVIFSDGFKNTKELFKKEEIRYCNDVADRSSYLTGSGPYGESTAGFKNLLESGERLKFVISGKGMFIGKINISHASIASFQQVMTAGHVRCTGSIKFDRETCGFRRVKKLKIDNETGHYQTTVDSLKQAANYFDSMGYDVSVARNWLTGEILDLNSLHTGSAHGFNHKNINMYYFSV